MSHQIVMDDDNLPKDSRPTIGVVSYAEAGDVAFAFLALRSQAERIVEHLAAGDDGAVRNAIAGLISTTQSSEKFVSAAQRMAKWAGS